MTDHDMNQENFVPRETLLTVYLTTVAWLGVTVIGAFLGTPQN